MAPSNTNIPPGIEPEVVGLRAQGMEIELVFQDGQCFVRGRGLATPVPPWGNTSHDILIAVPMAYETAGLGSASK